MNRRNCLQGTNTGKTRWRGILHAVDSEQVIEQGTDKEFRLFLRCVCHQRERNDRTVWRRMEARGQ
jgi:hypothetical protein